MRFRSFCFIAAALLAVVTPNLASAQGCSGGTAFSAPSGCSGGVAFSQGPHVGSRHLLASIEERRPHIAALLAEAFVGHARAAADHAQANHAARLAARSTGCGGGTSFAAPNCGVQVSLGCQGGTGFAAMPRGTVRSVIVVPAPVQVALAAPPMGAGGFIQRAAIHRQLRKALQNGTLTADQMNALNNPDIYENCVSEAHKILLKAHASQKSASVGALGDGHILQMILNAMPQIITAIQEILKLFGH